jgi:signal transduction histidine kinase/ligand-binding sensor domain-containing protein/DNA-binding response OmpR family regulator
MMIRYIAAIFLFFIFLNGHGKQVNFTSLGIKEGLSQLTVHSIYQDETGAMWFGTRRGLNRYNGNQIETLPIIAASEVMNIQHIWNITGDQKGSVYLKATNNLIRYDLRKNIFETIVEGGVDLIHYQNNKLYLIKNNQLFQVESETNNLILITSLENRHFPVKQILISRNDALWLATNAGLLKINSSGLIENTFFAESTINTIKEDIHFTLWVGTRNDGVFRLNPHNETFSSFEGVFANNDVRCIEEDNNGDIWIGTFRGLVRIDPSTGMQDHYLPIEKMPHSLSHSSVYSLFKDKQGTIWVGTYFGGVNYFNPGRDLFKIFIASSYYPDHISFPIVGKMTEDNNGNIWICTEGGGLNKYNPKTGKVKVFKNIPGGNSLSHDNLKSIWFDKFRNKLYVGTHMGGLTVLDVESEKFTNYLHNPDDPKSLPNNVVNKLSGMNDRLILVTQRGIREFNLKTNEISILFHENEQGLFNLGIENVFTDSKGRLWMALYSNELIKFNLNTRESVTYWPGQSDPGQGFLQRITHIFEDSRKRLFFTTEGAGVFLFDEESRSFVNFTMENSNLLSNICFSLSELPSGRLVISSDKGITLFDIDKNSTRHFLLQSGIPLSGIIEENGLFVAGSGEIFVGGTDGMVSFFEPDIETVPSDYNLYFSKLYVNNELVSPGDERQILNESLAFTDQIELKHGQTNVIFEFTSSNYIRHVSQEFEYMLEGFDRNWIPAQSSLITYTNISPGSYTMKVRERNYISSENQKEAIIQIKVMPAWYASQLAYIIYFLFILSLFVGFIVFDRNRTMLKASLAFERKENVRIEELNQSKLRFFTNISHEFRTPLTLIISQIELIVQNPEIPQSVLNQIVKIQKHAMRMRHLVNELLDFRKQEQGHLKLKVSYNNLVEFLHDIYLSFQDFAQSREIDFQYENPGESIQVWFDPGQMQKVFYNLLSNAFKFTRPGDIIKIRLVPKTGSIVIKIIDSGKGIPVDELNRIFDRFYQAENIASDSTFVMSSGIGLALTKGIVELHGGTITVESIEGEGSTFRLEIPLGDAHFTSDQKLAATDGSMKNLQKLDIPDKVFIDKLETIYHTGGVKPTILIVEDNEDIQHLLVELFSPLYHVFTAGNGEEGLIKTREIVPDIVLSDVMMAKMSGREMCRKIKSQYELSHIPVVLLTSQNTPEQIAEGFMHGADDYLTKPFDAKVLIIRCNNLVNGRRMLRERFSNMLSQAQTPMASNASDQELLSKIDKIIETNLDNSNFNIDILARETGMGRSKLYASVKEITGITPNTYILNYKMFKAAEWLKDSRKLTVSEIAYNLGFNAARYFSLCFKDHYGVSPVEYRKKAFEE